MSKMCATGYFIFYAFKKPEPISIPIILASKSIYDSTSNLMNIYFTIFQGSGNDIFTPYCYVCKHAVQ